MSKERLKENKSDGWRCWENRGMLKIDGGFCPRLEPQLGDGDDLNCTVENINEGKFYSFFCVFLHILKLHHTYYLIYSNL